MSTIFEGGPVAAAETRETDIDRVAREGGSPAPRWRWWRWSCPASGQIDPAMHRSAGVLWTFAGGQGG